jgi:WD40 repeat protein
MFLCATSVLCCTCPSPFSLFLLLRSWSNRTPLLCPGHSTSPNVFGILPELEILQAVPDMTRALGTFTLRLQIKSMQTYSHSSEGFALGWSRQAVGTLASGDCRGKLHVWNPKEGGTWVVSGAYKGHEGSVEDIEWSPTEETVFATACVDKVRW